MAEQKPPMVVVICGPTAAGKSDVAALVCEREKGMIISADSVQAYRGVQIGANKPTSEELRDSPHLLINVADHEENYNAAEWREDALFCIRTLLLQQQEPEANPTSSAESSKSRREDLRQHIENSRRAKKYDLSGEPVPVLPVICGGTMMYVQWLVHGRPDACRPTRKAIQEAHTIMERFVLESNYKGAVEYVSSFGSVFADRTQQFCGEDWYRLRRTLEIALTVVGVQEQTPVVGDDNDNVNNGTNHIVDGDSSKKLDDLIQNLYSGERQGGLASLGYDVRCFFLCPDDRMSHTAVVDERCERMIVRGLVQETTELKLSGLLPEMAERAIGYRQTLEYLFQERKADQTEEALFDSFLNEFTTATRRYAKKQMSWFRKDADFVFVPVPLGLEKIDRIRGVATEILHYCQISRTDYEKSLSNKESKSELCKQENERQGKDMKFYQQFQRYLLKPGSKEYVKSLWDAVQCREKIRGSSMSKNPGVR